jgi:hypothetical protein
MSGSIEAAGVAVAGGGGTVPTVPLALQAAVTIANAPTARMEQVRRSVRFIRWTPS